MRLEVRQEQLVKQFEDNQCLSLSLIDSDLVRIFDKDFEILIVTHQYLYQRIVIQYHGHNN